MDDTRYLVGIDLGTTNTVVAYAAPGAAAIEVFGIEQLVAPGEVQARPQLPSLRYHPAPGELAEGELQLPWRLGGDEGAVLGQLARRLGAQVPGRLVASAKSWLSHAAVDRLADILPWGADPEVAKVSPVAASASYLAHVRAAWNRRFPAHPLERQHVVLTVPASFDEGARALTLRAAADAGLSGLRLLEEPQAAFYDWLYRHRANLARELAATRGILVVDVGGGTTDLTLISARLRDGEPELARTGVGKHLMLGGDNMDLALARMAEPRLSPGAGGERLSAGRMAQLIERCRAAKERLLAAGAPAETQVTLLGAGARLVGAARSATLARAEVESAIVDGFFPAVGLDEAPRARRAGLVEFGLPYASDPAITRHLAAFLSRHCLGGELPDTLLLNGGVFRAEAISARLLEVLGAWRGAPLRLLHNDDPDLAVARGAVAYALSRFGLAPKIGGGSARSYFLVLDPKQAEDGAARAVCVLPRGSEAGREILLPDRVFALRLGQPVRFNLVSASADGGHPPRAGELVALDQGDFDPLPPVASVMRPGQPGARQEVEVGLAAALTEVGTLEMHCVARDDPARRWKLEFQLRGDAPAQDDAARLPPRYPEAQERIERIFGRRTQQVDPKEVRQLRQQLEKLLGSRERWDTPLLRHLFDALWQRARARRRSADHERLWLNLAGFCVRPGFGYPLDDWRTGQLWTLFEGGVQHHKDSQVCAEWWTLWRRAAGGLEREAQLRLLQDFAFNLQADAAERKRRPVTLVAGGEDDMVRLAASLERIPPEYKTEIGDWMLDRMQKPGGAPVPEDVKLWAVGRIGARQPFYGSAHDVVAPDHAARWLERLFGLDWRRADAAAFAAAHLARMTGDRARDLDPGLRARVIARLDSSGAPASWIAMVREVVQLDEASAKRALGEALPPGLKLLR